MISCLNFRSDPRIPVLVSIKGPVLEDNELRLLQKYRPVGVLLFGENCENEIQVKTLINRLKQMGFIIAIDLEGKCVNRFRKFYPIDKDAFSFSNASIDEIYNFHYKIAKYAKTLGVDIILGPVTDVCSDPSAFMFKRCFSGNPRRVAECVTAAIRAYQDAGIFPVIKHLPGHGKAIDSHKELPTINASEEELMECDIAASAIVIQNLSSSHRSLPGAMVSHVIYSELDPHFPASLSKIIIKKIIREHIGIKNNLIFSDDMRMQAISKFLTLRQNIKSQNFLFSARR